MGFVVDHLDWTWVYWIMAIVMAHALLHRGRDTNYIFFS